MIELIPILLLVCLALIVLHIRKTQQLRKDITQLSQRVNSLQQEKRIIFDFLHDLGEAFTENLDRDQLLRIILQCAKKVTDAHGAAIYLWDEKHEKLIAESVSGIFPPPLPADNAVTDKVATRQEYLEVFLRSEHIAANSTTVIAQVAKSGQPVWIPDARNDARFPKFREESLCTRSYLAVPLIYRNEHLGVMALANREDETAFNSADFEVVKSVGDQAAYSLHSAQVWSELADKKKMDHDLEMAQDIQRILLPTEAPVVEGYEFAALNIPAQQVSGDYYDFIQIDQQRWGMVIADVSGKGIPASLIMAMCRSVLRSKAIGWASPAQVLREVNRQLYPDIREDMFITMIYLILDTATGTLTIARAGHEAPLVARKNFETIDIINSPGMALGIDSGSVFDELISNTIITLEPRDTVVVYTDGINEAVDEHGEEFGREHIKIAIKTAGNLGAESLVKNIVERVQRFSGGHPQNDDITLVAIQKK